MTQNEKARTANQQRKIDRQAQSLQDRYFRKQVAEAEQLRKRMLALQKQTFGGNRKPMHLPHLMASNRRHSTGATRGQGTWKNAGRVVSLLLKIHSGGRVGDSYASKQTGAELIDSNMLGQTPFERESEFLLDQARHPAVNPKNLFVHLSLSRPNGHGLDRHQWCEVTQRFLKKIGADGHYVAIRHTGTDNDHVHLIFSRSKRDGHLVSMSQNRWAWRQRVREVESEMAIEVVDQEVDQPIDAPTSDKLVSAQRRAARSGSSDPFIEPTIVTKILEKSSTPEEFATELAAVGIEIKQSQRVDGTTTGVLFKKLDAQEWLAGSTISRELSLPKIQSRLELNHQAIQKRSSEILIQRRRLTQNTNSNQRNQNVE